MLTRFSFSYGQTGPYANTPGYDVIMSVLFQRPAGALRSSPLTSCTAAHSEAEAGLMHITGEQDGPPVKVGVAVTGTFGVFRISHATTEAD